MHASSPGEHVHEFAEPEILRQRLRDDILGHQHEFPTPVAGVLANTADPYIVVVIHVEVEDELPLHGLVLFVVFAWRTCPYGSHVHLPREVLVHTGHPAFHFIGGVEFYVALYHIIKVLEG
jgi:hypothetical protein